MRINISRIVMILPCFVSSWAAADEVRDFRLTIAGNPSGQRFLNWSTIPGRTYEIEESASLALWNAIPGSRFVADEKSSQHPLPSLSGPRFVRVVESRLGPDWQEAFFNLTSADGTVPDLTLENKLRELIGKATPGSTLRACVYTWDREEMIAPFEQAVARGVDVRLIVGVTNNQVRALSEALPGRVLVCTDSAGEPNGCHGGRINHNKFFLFSELDDGHTHCVLQSSANLTNLQLVDANNSVLFRNDAALYQTYRNYWNDLAEDLDRPNYYRKEITPSEVEVHFFPRSSANGTTGFQDPIVEILREIKPLKGGSIRVAMAFWTGPRRGIVDWLSAFQKVGMDVQVLVDREGTSSTITNALATGGINPTSFPQLHSKYMLIDAEWRGVRQKLVLTGSHNYTGPALTSNDEALLVISNPLIYEAFLENWKTLREHPLTDE